MIKDLQAYECLQGVFVFLLLNQLLDRRDPTNWCKEEMVAFVWKWGIR